ncbi:hypothetical protein P154DRAFT_197725 [Amniculicola lignicola CBS 123094]|uniref:Uncharacterized protein n=1 Tax=Amniculicola lignicola CBS 123094 TaxID=1392246 RepID=A0A6A5WIC9_9PLEO|nr:hypothetical protein P154DRAFT_197725 [Amniculicola lignicola CBS 123094]
MTAMVSTRPSTPPPALPPRNPRHHARPTSECLLDAADLVPPPLFARRRRHPLSSIPVPSLAIPDLPAPSHGAEYPSSPDSFKSARSSISSIAASPTSTAPSSPSSFQPSFSRTGSSTVSSSSPSYSAPPILPLPYSYYSRFAWDPIPHHELRRKKSPKQETLRSLRAKESEACLQRMYNQQTLAYLDGSIFARTKRRPTLDRVDEC